MSFLLTCACCAGIEGLFLWKTRRLDTRTELPIVLLANAFTFIISNIILRKLLHTGGIQAPMVLIMVLVSNLASIAVEYLIFSLAFERKRLGFGIVCTANTIAFVLSFPLAYLFALLTLHS